MTAPPNEIRNVALLDLTGATSNELLDRITSIDNVATILVPESLMGRLMAIPMRNVATTVPVPDGKRVKVLSGQVVLSGEALADPQAAADDILVIAGQLVLTSPVPPSTTLQRVIAMGQVLAPAGSETGLGAALTRMSGQNAFYPYTPGANVRVVNSARMSGAELANPAGQPNDILVCIGQLVVTSPVEHVGFQHIASIGQVVAPSGSEAALLGRVTSFGSGVVFYTAPPRAFDGKDHFSAAFFELLDEPITLVLDGKFSFDDDISAQLLKQKVREIVLDGKITAPRHLVPMLQVLSVVRDGTITPSDDA